MTPNSTPSARQDVTEWDEALVASLAIGCLVTDRALNLLDHDHIALRMLDSLTADELRDRWEVVREPVFSLLSTVPASFAGFASCNLESDPRSLRANVHDLKSVGIDGYLLLIRDQDLLANLARTLRFAVRSVAEAQSRRSQVHDLRAPLNAMSLNLDLALEFMDDAASESRDARVKKSLSAISKEISRLSRLAQGLLVEGGAQKTTRRRFDLRRLVREVATLLRPLAAENHLRVVSRIPKEPLIVDGHRDQIKQAVLNVAVNGLESMRSGAGILSLICMEDDDEIVLEIIDEGTGIDPERLRHVFDLNFTTKPTGSGVGLFAARSTFVSHGGDLSLLSEVGKGSKAVARLPRKTERQEQEERDA